MTTLLLLCLQFIEQVLVCRLFSIILRFKCFFIFHLNRMFINVYHFVYVQTPGADFPLYPSTMMVVVVK